MTADPSSPAVLAGPGAVAVRALRAMADGDRASFDPLYHPRAADRDNGPPSSRVPGPAGFYATALWLRNGFAGLRYDIHHAAADGDLVAVNATMSGRHVAPWAVCTDDGAVDAVFPPTGKTSSALPAEARCRFTMRSTGGSPESAMISADRAGRHPSR